MGLVREGQGQGGGRGAQGDGQVHHPVHASDSLGGFAGQLLNDKEIQTEILNSYDNNMTHIVRSGIVILGLTIRPISLNLTY